MSRYNATRSGRFLHISAAISHRIDPKTGIRTAVVMRPGRSYRRAKTAVEQFLDGLSGRQRRRYRKLIVRWTKENA